MSKPLIATTCFILILTGCMAMDDERTAGHHDTASRSIISANIISANIISANIISANIISANIISANIISANSFELDTDHSSGLEETEDGRLFLSYLAKCSLNQGEELVTTVDQITYVFPGLFGLAPDWVSRALTESEKRMISACILAHANHFGVSVPISVRGDMLDISAEEFIDFPVYEATFYGSVFDSPMKMYACQGTSRAVAEARSPYRQWRVCSDIATAFGDATHCSPNEQEPFLYTGPCEQVCSHHDDRNGWSGCSVSRRTKHDGYFMETLSVWLMSHQDQ